MKIYEQLDISGDIGLRVWGKTLEELFENAAIGMSGLITDTSNIEETGEREITLSSDSNEGLLIQWLNELIFLFDAEGFIGKVFKVSLHDNGLKAKVSGGNFNPEVNESRLLIKAATYHGLSLKKNNSHWEATVIFDI
jgi:SHS2 domain-containing protein